MRHRGKGFTLDPAKVRSTDCGGSNQKPVTRNQILACELVVGALVNAKGYSVTRLLGTGKYGNTAICKIVPDSPSIRIP